MKIPRLNPYYRASLLLFGAAFLLIVIAVATDRHDLTSAALVISALACLITGIFVSALSTAEPLDTAYVSLLAPQGAIGLCRLSADLGIQGTAHVIPPHLTGREGPVQFNPVSSFTDLPEIGGESLLIRESGAGIVSDPSGLLLYQRLKKDENLVIPADPAEIPAIIREVLLDALEIADTAACEQEGSRITVTFTGYRLSGGCRILAAESPRCCSMQPCPVVSLLSCIIAESTGSVVAAERCSCSEANDQVAATFELLSFPDRKPEVEIPVARVDPVHAPDT